MRNISDYVDEMFEKVPPSNQKQEIMQDIKQNLEEKVSDLIHEGKSQEDAINKAIVEFGDIDDIRGELTSLKGKKYDKHLLNLGFSIGGSLLIIALGIFINLYYDPWVIWYIYPTFAVLWWPLTMLYIWLKNK